MRKNAGTTERTIIFQIGKEPQEEISNRVIAASQFPWIFHILQHQSVQVVFS